MPARAIGSGTISFGLVAIPVKLYSTGEPQSAVSFNMVHRTCGTRLKYRYWCPTDEVFVERDEMGKGYEFAKGQYVLFTDDELKALEAEATNAIEIAEFVPLAAVDPIYFEKSYYLGPDKGGTKPYRLLALAMKESGFAALANYLARGRSYLVLLRPFENGLVMQQLRFADELRGFDEVPVGDADVKPAELDLALRLVDQIASDRFDPKPYKDVVRERVVALIEKKVAGEQIVAQPEEAPKAQIIDLMAALKASLGEESAKKPARRAPREQAAAPAKARGGGGKARAGAKR
ncbi:MAG TPA: Ku protein [Thermoanaerobaculia bacterium]|nr:Ku protein [Thermoanaerobaculia bacterium]